MSLCFREKVAQLIVAIALMPCIDNVQGYSLFSTVQNKNADYLWNHENRFSENKTEHYLRVESIFGRLHERERYF